MGYSFFEMVNKSAYAKKPLWFWVLLYVVVGGIVYYAAYYLFFANQGVSPYQY